MSGLGFVSTAESREYKSLAILDFELISGPPAYSWLESAIPQSLSSKLIKIDVLKVVDRTNLDSIFNELKLSLSGLTDEPLNAGNLLISEFYISGRISVIQRDISVFTRITSSETGELVGAFTMKSSVSNISSLEDDIVREISRTLELPEQSAQIIEAASLSSMRRLHTVRTLYEDLPFHELHPRRNRMKQDFRRSIDDLEELAMDGLFVSDLYYYLGQLYLQLGEQESALSYFRFMIENSLDHELAYVGLGDLYRFNRNYAAGLENYNNALAENPLNIGALYGRIKALIRLNQIEEAFETTIMLINEKPDSILADGLIKSFSTYGDNLQREYRNIVSLFMNKREPEEADASRLPEQAGLFKELYLIPYYRGVESYLAGNYLKAEKDFVQSFSLFSSFDMVHYFLGYSLFYLEQYEKAYNHFQTYMKLSREGDRFSQVIEMIRKCEEYLP